MKVIAPCCGASSRFPNQAPKWMLPSHDGRPMLQMAVSGLEINLDDLVVTILRDHEQRFDVTRGLATAFGRPIRTVILDQPTRSQTHTVAETIKALNLSEPFLVKDSDNIFTLKDVDQSNNYVCVESLNSFDSINPRNKSYLQVDGQGFVTNMREKVVISDTFNVGGYYFVNPEHFLQHWNRLDSDKPNWNREIYLSDVIGSMILEGIPFRARRVSEYHDFGTINEWRQTLRSRSTYFTLVDGFLFERGSEYFTPRFAETSPNVDAVAAVKALADKGHTIIYVSIRPEHHRELTGEQIAKAGLPSGQLLLDCPVAQWVLVTAPHASLPFQTSRALEVSPTAMNLAEKLSGELL
jgi:bifunctional N-acetylglucosamine-1-phosphate-uridyltransferase/glucosamine-1-phosphate-acetyltransferase GlmU-like protein